MYTHTYIYIHKCIDFYFPKTKKKSLDFPIIFKVINSPEAKKLDIC